MKDHFLINDEHILELILINMDLNDDFKINANSFRGGGGGAWVPAI